jgi:hypothetical protein
MRGVRAEMVSLLAALALSGSMQATAPVATAQSRSELDAMAYDHADSSGSHRAVVPLGTPLGPGDTILVGERWL